MNEDYSQSFCIIGSKGKFHESYTSYLPPLEVREIPIEEEQPKTVVVIHRSAAKEAHRFSQLEGKVNYLLKELKGRSDKEKPFYTV